MSGSPWECVSMILQKEGRDERGERGGERSGDRGKGGKP